MELPHGALWIARTLHVLLLPHPLIITYNTTHGQTLLYTPTCPRCVSGRPRPPTVCWGFELLCCAVTVTIIQTLEDWRVIELWPLMEFLYLSIWKLKLTFAYFKWPLMRLQNGEKNTFNSSLYNMFVFPVVINQWNDLLETKERGKKTHTEVSPVIDVCLCCFFKQIWVNVEAIKWTCREGTESGPLL